MTTTKLGFNRVAPFYYYPGWWEGGPQVSFMVNKAQFEGLLKPYQTALETACMAANISMTAKYDVGNATAIRSLVAGEGASSVFPREVMEASFKAAHQLYDEISAENANFKKIYEPWKKFRDDEELWFRVAEYSFDNFLHQALSKKS